jgi:hypothetical protein
MKLATVLCLFACVYGALSGGHGRDHGGQHKLPKLCSDEFAENQQCFQTQLTESGVNINLMEAKACFDNCHQSNRTHHGRHTRGTRHGSSHSDKEAMKAFHQCIKQKTETQMDDCMDEKVDFESVDLTEMNAPKRHRRGHHGYKVEKVLEKARKCGGETQSCIREKVGTWYTRVAELATKLCDAATACPYRKSPECKSQQRELAVAHCECRKSMEAAYETAKAECTTDENRAMVERMSSHHRTRTTDCNTLGSSGSSESSGDDSAEKPSEWCPRTGNHEGHEGHNQNDANEE